VILEIVCPLWKEYLVVPGYDSIKYPEEIYQAHLMASEIDNKWIRESLIWKFGKWNQYIEGSRIPRTHEAAIIKFMESLNYLRSLKAEGDPSLCQDRLQHLPEISAVFLAHLLFPDCWAIVDQHTVRFLHWVHLQIENYNVQTSSPWDLSQELNSFQSLLANRLSTTKREIDKFMMTLGKRLRHNPNMPAFKNRKRSIVNKLHFKEIEWVIYFPATGNEGRKIRDYGVAYRDRVSKETQPGRRISLRDVLVRVPIQNRYPHAVGLFLDASGKGPNWTPAYIETRLVHTEKELLDWIAEIEEG